MLSRQDGKQLSDTDLRHAKVLSMRPAVAGVGVSEGVRCSTIIHDVYPFYTRLCGTQTQFTHRIMNYKGLYK